jgi:hypothetical protein
MARESAEVSLLKAALSGERIAAMSIGKSLVGESAAFFFIHLPLALVGGFIVGRIGASLVGILLTGFGTVATIASAVFAFTLTVLLGFVANQFMQHRSASWVGALGLVWFVVAASWDILSYRHSSFYRARTGGHFISAEFIMLFSPHCGERWDAEECGLEQLLVTVPVLISVAYSLGA